MGLLLARFFFYKRKTTYALLRSLVGSEVCIRGGDPRRRYYSDNWRALRNAAEMAGLQHESCLPGIHQTNGIAESNSRTILSGTRRLLMQAGLPACWWPYAAPCFCFL